MRRYTWAAVSCPASVRSAAASPGPARCTARSGEPTTAGGTGVPSQPSTVGVRSVSRTSPGWRVEAAVSSPPE